MLYEVFDTVTKACMCSGHTLWGALAMCRDLNTRGRCPGRYACRQCGQ